MRFTKSLERKEALFSLLDDFLLLEFESYRTVEFRKAQLERLKEMEADIQQDDAEKMVATSSYNFLYSEISYAEKLAATYRYYASDLRNRISREDE